MPQEPKGNNMKSFYKGAIFICVLTIGITFFNDILRDPLEVKPVNLTTNLAVLVVLLILR